MAAYYYLISSLPMLKPDEDPPFDYSTFLEMCKTAVNKKVYSVLKTLGVNSREGHFASEWAAFYRSLSTELNYQRNLKLRRPCTAPGLRDSTISKIVRAALAARNPLESEQILLKLEFSRLDSMIGLHNFDEYALYGYALKLKLLERQRRFRHETGKQAFEDLLDRVQQQIFSM